MDTLGSHIRAIRKSNLCGLVIACEVLSELSIGHIVVLALGMHETAKGDIVNPSYKSDVEANSAKWCINESVTIASRGNYR